MRREQCPYKDRPGFVSGRKNEVSGDWNVIERITDYPPYKYIVKCVAHERQAHYSRSISNAVSAAKTPLTWCVRCYRKRQAEEREKEQASLRKQIAEERAALEADGRRGAWMESDEPITPPAFDVAVTSDGHRYAVRRVPSIRRVPFSERQAEGRIHRRVAPTPVQVDIQWWYEQINEHMNNEQRNNAPANLPAQE